MKKLISLGLLTFLCGCAVQVKNYQKPNTDISRYETWCWMEGCEVTYQGPEEYYNEEALNALSLAVEEQMAKKGYIRNDDEQDLLLNFYLIVEMKEHQIVEPPYDGRNMEMRWLPEVYPEFIHFIEGSLVIDVIDRRASELIWRGNAIKYLDIQPKMNKKLIFKTVEIAMRKLPERDYQ